MKTLLEVINQFPPTLVRAVARTRNGRKPISDSEISRRSGLSKDSVARISRLRSWDTIGVNTMDSFSTACGVNLLHVRRHIDYLRRRKKVAVLKSPRQTALLVETIHGRSQVGRNVTPGQQAS